MKIPSINDIIKKYAMEIPSKCIITVTFGQDVVEDLFALKSDRTDYLILVVYDDYNDRVFLRNSLAECGYVEITNSTKEEICQLLGDCCSPKKLEELRKLYK